MVCGDNGMAGEIPSSGAMESLGQWPPPALYCQDWCHYLNNVAIEQNTKEIHCFFFTDYRQANLHLNFLMARKSNSLVSMVAALSSKR